MRYKELIRKPRITTVQELQGWIFKLMLVASVVFALVLMQLYQ